MSNSKEIIKRALKLAHEQDIETGFVIGADVIHPSDEFVWGLEAIEGDVAVLEIPADKHSSGKAQKKRVPLEGLCYSKTLLAMVSKAMEQLVNEGSPEDSGVFVVDL